MLCGWRYVCFKCKTWLLGLRVQFYWHKDQYHLCLHFIRNCPFENFDFCFTRHLDLIKLGKKSCSSPFNWVCTFREICSIYFICFPVHDIFLRIPFLSLEDISLNWHGNIAILISGIWLRKISVIFSLSGCRNLSLRNMILLCEFP